jgi:hypothetical protein
MVHHAAPSNGTARVDFTQLNAKHIAMIIGPHVQGNYSVALYGAEGRVPLKTLKIVWLPLLSTQGLRAIQTAGGICLLHAKFTFPTFYSPHNPKFDPQGSMWLRRDYGVSHNRVLPNHSWVEVTHCGYSSTMKGDKFVAQPPLIGSAREEGRFFWDVGPSWYYVAPGSGVSINVGRTISLGWQAATRLIMELYSSLWSHCGESNDGKGFWRVRLNSTRDDSSARRKVMNATRARDQMWSPWLPSIPASERVARLGLDSIQVTGHREYFSVERRHEIIMLHQPNCAELSALRGKYMCGREPWLFACDGGEAVQRLARCCSMTGCADPLGLKRMGMDGSVDRYRCLGEFRAPKVSDLSQTDQ